MANTSDKRLHQITRSNKLTILDGGMGDEIHKFLQTTEQEWSAPGLLEPKHHDFVKQLHKEFALAGSDWLTTANFSVRLRNGFSEEQITEACKAAGMLARQAADETSTDTRKVRVLGSLPPLLDCFRRETELANEEQYDIIIDSLFPFVDAFIGETLSSVEEANQVLRAASKKKIATKPCWISFAPTSEGLLYSGERPSRAIVRLLKKIDSGDVVQRPQAILFNCSSPEAIEKALQDVIDDKSAMAILEKNNCQLGAYPNRYRPVDPDWKSLVQSRREELTPDVFAKTAIQLSDKFRLSLFGGCCGISKEFIQALKVAIDEQEIDKKD